MKYLAQLVQENGHKLVRANEAQAGHDYITAFEYSTQHGGTYDSHKYYNEYYVEVS